MSEPTPTQALLLFGLLARHGACPQAELMPAVKKADRETLVKARLIAVGKVGRGLHLTLEDAGWAWAGAHLSTELPPAQRTAQDLLARLGEHLATSGATLADFIGSKPMAAATRSPKPRKPASKAKQPTPATLRRRIEQAYLAITGGKTDESVRLANLRAALADLDRETVDAALGRILAGDRKASLLRHDDPRQIDRADADAAYSPAGEPFHVLWIKS